MGKKMKLIVGYDGSPCADAALDDLRNAGLPPKADVVVISAANVFLPRGPELKAPEPIRSSIQKSRMIAKKEFQKAKELAQGARALIKRQFPKWNVKCEPCADSPAWAIVKKAAEWRVDLAVVGSHRMPKFSKFFLGSEYALLRSEFIEAAGVRKRSGPTPSDGKACGSQTAKLRR